jgi:cyclophilin family peptidyl-prolyl cis-trans isomerase
VIPSNDAPTANPIADTKATMGRQFAVQVVALDPEQDSIEYELEVDGNAFMLAGTMPQISQNGLITWTPDRAGCMCPFSTKGTLTLTVKLTDSNNASHQFSFDVRSEFEQPVGDVPSNFMPFSGQRQLSGVRPSLRNGLYDEAPDMSIDTSQDYRAIIRTENGDMVFDLLESESPVTVNNFVCLAEDGYFDGLTFHRVIASFVAQGGDPLGTGTGGPGYVFNDEVGSGLQFNAVGQLAMANRGTVNGGGTNGSQFFVTLSSTLGSLNGKHTIFGQLVSGGDVLSEIRLRDPNTATAPGDTIHRVIIETV